MVGILIFYTIIIGILDDICTDNY